MKKLVSLILVFCLMFSCGSPGLGLAAETEAENLETTNQPVETDLPEAPDLLEESTVNEIESDSENENSAEKSEAIEQEVPKEKLEELVDNLTQPTTVPEETTGSELLNDLDLLQNGDFPDPTVEVETFSDYSEAQAYLHQEMLNLSCMINLSDYQIPVSEANDFLQDLVNSSPDLFVFTGAYNYSWDSENMLTWIIPTYIDQAEAKLTEYQEVVTGIINNLLKQMGNNLSNREKVLLVQDYLAANYNYDNTLTIYDAYNFFTQKTGVCQAYTLAVIELLNRLNIPVSYVTSDEDNHIWNAVQIDGKWYHLDVTHNDPTCENGMDFKGRVSHGHYLISSEKLLSVCDSHDNFKAKYVMDDQTYDNYFWKDVKQSFVYSGEKWYYALYNANNSLTNICQWEPATNQSTLEKSLYFHWPNWNDANDSWPGFYSGLSYYKGSLLYNDSRTIYSYDLTNKQQRLLLIPPITEGYIYSFALDNNILYYQLAQDPNNPGTIHQLSLAVPVSGISLDKTSLILESGDQETLTASIDPVSADDQAVIWSSDNEAVVTVDSSGQVKAVAAGKANITATTADGGFTATCAVSVTAPAVTVTGVSLNYTALKLYPEVSKQITAIIAPSDASNKELTWNSSNSEIVEVNGQGLITTKNPGSAVITVETVDGKFNSTCQITVVKRVTGVKLNYTALKLYPDTTKQLSATVSPKDAYNKKLVWSSSNSRVASVNSQGLVTMESPGSAVIMVKTLDGNFAASCQIAVVKKVTGVELDYTALSLDIGASQQITALVFPSDAYNKKLTWTSSDPNIASVDSKGLVTAVGSGSAIITAKTVEGGFMADCQVTVGEPGKRVTGVKLNYTTLKLYPEVSKQITATIAPSDASNRELTWSSSNSEIVGVDGQGLITTKNPGSAVITVETVDGRFNSTCQITVVKRVTGVKLNYTALKLYPDITKQLSATVSPKDAYNKKLIWSSSNSRVASVNSQGLVTMESPGSAVIMVKTLDGNFTASCQIAVVKKVTGVELDSTALNLDIGVSQQLAALISPSDAYNRKLTWTSSNAMVATVDSKGLVTAVGSGSAIITAKTVEGGFMADCQVTVGEPGKRVTGVKLNYTTLKLYPEFNKQITATVAPNDANNKELTWSSSNPEIVEVNSQGLITTLAPGSAVVTVETVDGKFNSTCQITVVKRVTGVKLNYTALKLYPDTTKQLAATVSPKDAYNKKLIWSSSNSRVASVNSQGLVTMESPGSAVIMVKTLDGNFTASCQISVVKKVMGVDLDTTDLSLDIGVSQQLAALIFPSDAYNKKLTWTSSDPNIALVDPKGLVTAVNFGSAIITAKTVDGGFVAECQVTVGSQVVTGVDLSENYFDLYPDEKVILVASPIPSTASKPEFVWSSSDNRVAAVSTTGEITAISSGTALIKAATVEGDFENTCEVTVMGVDDCQSPIVEPVDNPFDPGSGRMLSIELNKHYLALKPESTETLIATVIRNSDSAILEGAFVSWSSSDESVVTVDSGGKLTAVGYGFATITAAAGTSYKTYCEIMVTDYPDLEQHSGDCGYNLTWTLDTRSRVLTIEGIGSMYNYEQNEIPWSDLSYIIEKVNIGSRVTKISDYAFYNCQDLTTAKLGGNLTSIGKAAFYNCDSLTSIDLGGDLTKIGNYAFYNCWNLARVDFAGKAPTSFGSDVFGNTASDFTIYYWEGESGWTTPSWNGYKTVAMTPSTGGDIVVVVDPTH